MPIAESTLDDTWGKNGKWVFGPPGLRVDGRYVGRHRSIRLGKSQEFEDHRLYQPGDNIADVDWRLYARTRRLYIKRFEQHTQLSVQLMLDASGSMGYGGELTGGAAVGLTSKWDKATQAALGLSQVVLNQQDRVTGWVAGGEGGGVAGGSGGVGGGGGQKSRLMRLFEQVEPGGQTSLADQIQQAAMRQRRAVLVVFSDLMTEPKPLLRALAAWRARGGRVLVVQVLHAHEVALPTGFGAVEAVDLEVGGSVMADEQVLAEAFAKRSRAWVDQWRRALLAQQADHRLWVVGGGARSEIGSWQNALQGWLRRA